MADYQNDNSVAQAARVTANRDVVVAPNILKWAVQGKIFEAGLGLEDTEVNSQATIADITGTFSLQAPSASAVLVVPILARLIMKTEGGAAPSAHVTITKPSGLTATALTLSGTAMTSKHSVYRTNPAQTSQQATALYGDAITVSVLVAADYVLVNALYLQDNLITAGTSPLLPYDVYTMAKDGPHVLTSGAAMIIYISTATLDSAWFPYFKWAELTEDDLV